MSKPREIWWGYVKAIIRRYPELCAREAALREQGLSNPITGMPHGGKVANPTADAALRELPEKQQREVAAVRAAIVKTQALPDGEERMQMVALKLHRCLRTIKQWHGDFIRAVERELDLP